MKTDIDGHMIYGNLTILLVEWLQVGITQQIGIIVTKDLITKDVKTFVGYSSGRAADEESDIEYIISWGAKFKNESFENHFKNIFKTIELHEKK